MFYPNTKRGGREKNKLKKKLNLGKKTKREKKL
jgi:hypothetical protein